ncbi:MAG TPA: LysM peptidoglycan-binding domain-containing protein [Bryobacteraceae bacterium]|nr:LysM peptidoglycan-binding domain-containing protein [Bryobacteraceae bacterium]
MRTASDIADWWDEQHKISEKALDRFVDEYPGLFGVVVATAVATAMEVGKGTVDVLRFGEGIAEGTVGGVAQDALRALSIAGALGKGAKIVKELASRSRMMKLIVDPGGRAAALGGGGRCVYVSATQALRQTGQKAFAAVDDLASELGLTLDDLGTSSGAQMRMFLTKLKARIGPALNVKSWNEVERAVPHDGSVLSFGVSFSGGGGHRLYAFRDALGRVKIMDRGGKGNLPKVLDTLDDVIKRYGKTGVAKFNEAFEIKDLFLKFVGPKGFATLAMEVLATTAGDAEATADLFEGYKQEPEARQKRQPTTIVMDPIYIKAGEPVPGGFYTVKSGDSLSKIAQRAYGDMMKFGVIYMANRETIGPNVNLIKPKQELWIPVLESAARAQ